VPIRFLGAGALIQQLGLGLTLLLFGAALTLSTALIGWGDMRKVDAPGECAMSDC
jgi:hypothetical protein